MDKRTDGLIELRQYALRLHRMRHAVKKQNTQTRRPEKLFTETAEVDNCGDHSRVFYIFTHEMDHRITKMRLVSERTLYTRPTNDARIAQHCANTLHKQRKTNDI